MCFMTGSVVKPHCKPKSRLIWVSQFHSYCVFVKNITVSVDDEVYRQARVAAAKRGTRVSALVGSYLQAVANGSAPASLEDEAQRDRLQRLRLAQALKNCNLVLAYRPTREKTYKR